MLKDYWLLLKPELTLLSVFTGTMSCYMALPNNLTILEMLPFLLKVTVATFLLGGTAAILNQLLEVKLDSKMKRTEARPLPANRISNKSGWIYAIIFGVLAVIFSFLFLPSVAFAAGILTVGTYILFYTPIKRISIFSTIIGAIPGALPPIIGWTTVTNSINPGAWVLFSILFLWQMPHFYSLGWMYRKDYERANFKILPVTDKTGTSLGLQNLFNIFLLYPISLIPAILQMVSENYFYLMLVIGFIFTIYGFRFSFSLLKGKEGNEVSINKNARKLFYATLIYLPVLFFILAFYKI